MSTKRSGWGRGLLMAMAMGLVLSGGAARAAMGMTEIPASGADGPITVYYPSDSPSRRGEGPFALDLAADGTPVRGNGRLVVVTHGTGASPWVYADQARALVDAGFVVALPLHRADNYLDHSDAQGALERRPLEVSRAIDRLGEDARFAPLLALDRVGVYGMSAGGHTALTLAGGRWSYANFRRHCDTHLAAEVQFCVGVVTQLTGGMLDGLKQWVARTIIGWRFADETPRGHEDARIAAVVAAVPAAAIFEMPSLATPRVPLALVTARQDRWLVPRFHSDRVLQACSTCEQLVDLDHAGHGAYLSPLPPGLSGVLAQMLADPPGFDRAAMPAVHAKVAEFFRRRLLP
jgi:predicted dienelactone hydrolase